MNLVDSSGWLEYFGDAPNADFFAPAIEDVPNLLVPTICILEVFRRVLQQRDERAALQVAAIMQQGHVADMDSAVALNAARVGVDLKLPLADSVILATARMHNATIWTQDEDFKGLEGVRYVSKR
ncbi:MAG: type II toxin-antitoxin system VapC family toxin [Thermodesulfobacteriota bacterium]